MTGTLSIDGVPLAMTACTSGHDKTVFVEVATARGTLHFQNRSLMWNGETMACDALPTNKAIWGGGTRADGTAYFRGELKFTCKTRSGTVDGDLDLECGHITPAERAQLDANRSKKQDELRGSSR